MKTPEEIKRGLVTCTELVMHADVQHAAMADALAYIQQLETENHQLLTKAQQLESAISQVSKALCGKEKATLKELLQAANQLKARAPTIEAKPVVRCKECRKRRSRGCPMCDHEELWDDNEGWIDAYRDRTEDEGFCHMGAKMDGGAK